MLVFLLFGAYEITLDNNLFHVFNSFKVKYHSEAVKGFYTSKGGLYQSINYLSSEDDSPEHEARSEAM
jgi:hypothetical protein